MQISLQSTFKNSRTSLTTSRISLFDKTKSLWEFSIDTLTCRCFWEASDFFIFPIHPFSELAEHFNSFKALQYVSLLACVSRLSITCVTGHSYFLTALIFPMNLPREISTPFSCTRWPNSRLSFLGPVFGVGFFRFRGDIALFSPFLLIRVITSPLNFESTLDYTPICHILQLNFISLYVKALRSRFYEKTFFLVGVESPFRKAAFTWV